MSGPSSSLSTNPNSMGGSFNYDSRTGLGYGQTKNGGLGSSWDMGDALSSPKGEWDNDLPINNPDKIEINSSTTVRDLAIAAGLIEVEDEEITGVEAGIQSKANTSLHMPVTDFAAKKKRNPNSYVGLANTSSYLGSSYNRGSNVMTEVELRNFIREVILLEDASSISARKYVKARIGDPYKSSKSNVSNVSRGLGPRGTINLGYNSNGSQGVEVGGDNNDDLFPYASSKKLKATKDGSNLTRYNKVKIDDEFDNKRSSADVLEDINDEEFLAFQNVHRFK
jgi:hypothetical protein